MKLYNSMGPNPQMVRMYAAELGIELTIEEIDLMAGENRQSPYLSINASGQTPALELDDGTIIAEITAICEYLDDMSCLIFDGRAVYRLRNAKCVDYLVTTWNASLADFSTMRPAIRTESLTC